LFLMAIIDFEINRKKPEKDNETEWSG
jgi:hypothetical protein